MNNNLTILYQKFDSMRQKISTYNFIQIDKFLSTNDCEGIKFIQVYTSVILHYKWILNYYKFNFRRV